MWFRDNFTARIVVKLLTNPTMKILLSSILLCVLLAAATMVGAQTLPAEVQTNGSKPQTPINLGPVVNDCWPKTGSVNSVINLQGFRLGSGDEETAKAFVIQNRHRDSSSHRWRLLRNQRQLEWRTQTLEVILPEEVVPGAAKIVVEKHGRRSSPVSITITEWTLPVIKSISPQSGPPGTFVHIDCDNFHIYDEIELTDEAGKVIKEFESGGSSSGTGFGVPNDFPDGVLRIRIGSRKAGRNQFTEPVEFVVTSEASALGTNLGMDYSCRARTVDRFAVFRSDRT
jgi:hypothetical protein